jgi:dTDP-4-dehydrorhamnose 3,5-epimerase
MSRSSRGVRRGLHLQNTSGQGELFSVLRGRVLDVAVDVRPGSPGFASHVAVGLSEDSRRQLWIPRSFAHGFVVLSEIADFSVNAMSTTQPRERNHCALETIR